MMDTLLKTPLYDFHVQLGARMVDFAGWAMPVQYTGIVEEHVHTRTSCGVFDVSHMGRLRFTGKDAERFLERVCTRRLAGAEVGRSFYSHVCRDDGGILDDVIVSRFEDSWGMVCNASNREKLIAWFERQKNGFLLSVTDETLATAMVALQGPRTIELAKDLAAVDQLTALKRYHFMTRELGPMRLMIYRSGYSGEDGFEIVMPAMAAKMLVPRLFGKPEEPRTWIKPAGLGARDTLRLEAGMPLYGHELTEDVDSLTAGQEWCVDLSKDFIGAVAMRRIKEENIPTRLVGLEVEGRRIARQHFKVFAGGRELGEITSGTLSPTLDKSIAMAFVPSEFSAVGTPLEVDLGAKRAPAGVVSLPFYSRPR